MLKTYDGRASAEEVEKMQTFQFCSQRKRPVGKFVSSQPAMNNKKRKTHGTKHMRAVVPDFVAKKCGIGWPSWNSSAR